MITLPSIDHACCHDMINRKCTIATFRSVVQLLDLPAYFGALSHFDKGYMDYLIITECVRVYCISINALSMYQVCVIKKNLKPFAMFHVDLLSCYLYSFMQWLNIYVRDDERDWKKCISFTE